MPRSRPVPAAGSCMGGAATRSRLSYPAGTPRSIVVSVTAVSETRFEVQIERQVPIPMRDGTILRADVYRPAAEGRFPVLLERVGYELGARVGGYGPYYAQRGFVVVGQNVRGAFASEGELVPFRDDSAGSHQDGYDTVEWAAAQPWSNGNVGMVDGSYSGFTQYAVAPTTTLAGTLATRRWRRSVQRLGLPRRRQPVVVHPLMDDADVP